MDVLHDADVEFSGEDDIDSIDPSWDDLQAPPPPMRRDRDDLPPLAPGWQANRARLVAWVGRIIDQPLASWVTFAVVAGAAAFILYTLHPELIFRNTTPTGGDMGAHVWGPMYLLRHVLPHGEISGWTPDWYAGFPAFRYYMVVPALAIIGLHIGASGVGVALLVVVSLAIASSGFVVAPLFRFRKVLVAAGLIMLVVSVPIPYNVAFKIITVIGLVTMPISAWLLAKLADLRYPTPALFAVAATVFVYNREPLVKYPSTGELIGTGNIIGGNLLSTMAGEYSFSIALSLLLVYLGVLLRGTRTGRHKALAAGLLALVGLCHLLPFFFALLLTVLVWVLRPSIARFTWLFTMGLAAGAVASFWMLPFYWRRNFTIDMGFEQLPHQGLDYAAYLFPSRMAWIFLLAIVGMVVSIAYRNRVGQLFMASLVFTALAFRFMPQIQLWNARILPFYYLSLMLLAALGASGIIFAIGTLTTQKRGTVNAWATTSLTVLAAIAGFVFVAFPLQKLPLQHRDAQGRSTWLFLSSTDTNPGSGWAEWNFSGYEGRTKPTALSQNPYADFRNLVATMQRLGDDPAHGCGRAHWQTDNDREGEYGTPMALMLLPYWTDSCIGSMEGLYFESSATTPFHFINASELSEKPSNPMRGIDYPGFDVQAGVHHLQLLGVKYFLADTETAIQAAQAANGLTEVAVSGPWHIFQVADADLVEGLTHEPVVWDVKNQAKSSVQPSVVWYLDPSRWDVPFAASGPADWKRVEVDVSYWNHKWSTITDIVTQTTGKERADPLPRVSTPALPAVKVTNIVSGTDTISFDVDKVGVPVRVKVSYYPNWKVTGAKGPYRITPNQMVVIPTSKHVKLHYAKTNVEYVSYGLTIVGVGALIWFSQQEPKPLGSPLWERLSADWNARRRQEPDDPDVDREPDPDLPPEPPLESDGHG